MKRLITTILFFFVLIQCQNSYAQTRVWKQLTTGCWSAAATKLEAAPNGDLYAMIYGDEVSTEARMFKSVDHGGSWQRVTNLPNCSLPVACTAIGADGAFYFA